VPRHIEEDVNVPMNRTDRAIVPAGPFAGPLVVSMWLIPRDRVIADALGHMFIDDLLNSDFG